LGKQIIKIETTPPNIKINGQTLDIVEETKFLGIILDEELNWKKHIIYTSKKIAKSIGILSKTRQYLNQNALRQLYYSFIHPYLIYGNVIWGNASTTALWPIFELQKIAIRLITNTPRGQSTQDKSKLLRILRLPELYSYSTMIFMYKYTHNMMPLSLAHLFKKNRDVHNHFTRGASNLRTPKIRTNLAEKFITCTGVKLWNSLTLKIDQTLKISNFKYRLTTLLIADYKDGV
jgi:hypothetical protein